MNALARRSRRVPTARYVASGCALNGVRASSSRTGGPLLFAVLVGARGGVLSTEAVRLVRLVRPGTPGFVPFLFPGCMSVSGVKGSVLHARLPLSSRVGHT
jgi:hypothetical protein